MFKSQLSGKQYAPGVSPVKVVVERRTQTYLNEGKLSTGWEIVRELAVGPDEEEKARGQG